MEPSTPVIVCETARLRIQQFKPDDAAFALRLLNEPSFIKFIGDKGARTLGEARAYLLAGPLAGYARFGFGLNRVDLKESGTPIGMCGILKRDTLPDPDLGYAFLPEFWARGYAFEAATAIMAHAGRVLRLPRVLAVTTADNAASIRLLERTKFRFVSPVRLSADESELKLYSSELPPSLAAPL
jgi:RimJ/RimL family protein N-acetyltransferase